MHNALHLRILLAAATQRRPTILLYMCLALIVAALLAAIVLIRFGVGERGSEIALRATARWSFLLFWLAYVGRPCEKLFGSLFHNLARSGRQLGLAFASSMSVHIGIVLWLFYISAGPDGGMTLFWVGVLFTYALALFSSPQVRKSCPPHLSGALFTVGMESIAFVFATDFVLLRLDGTLIAHPFAYLPFALMLLCGATLRLAAFAQQLIIFFKGL